MRATVEMMQMEEQEFNDLRDAKIAGAVQIQIAACCQHSAPQQIAGDCAGSPPLDGICDGDALPLNLSVRV